MEPEPTEHKIESPSTPAGHEHKTTKLSKRTLMLIVVLAAFAVFFLVIALNTKWGKVAQIALPSPTPTPAYVRSILGLSPAATDGTPAGTHTYNLTIDSDTNIINAIQVELSFDPKVVANISILPGTFFTRPVQLLKNIDYKNGRISYALGIQPTDSGVKGKGTIAAISFTIKPGVTLPNTTIAFMPKTFVAAQGITPSVLKATTNAVIPVSVQQGKANQ